MSNDLEFGLGMNLGPLDKAGVAVGKWGEDTSKLLQKKFNGAEVFKDFIKSAGFLSVERIFEKFVAEPLKESAEMAEKVAEQSERAANAVERQRDARQTDLQQLATMEKSSKRLSDNFNDLLNKPATQKFFGIIERGSALDKLFGFSKREDAAKAVAIATNLADQEEKALEIAKKKQDIEDKSYEQQIRNSLKRAEYVKQNQEMLELEAKALSGRILPAERARLDILRLQAKQRDLEEQKLAILEKFPEQRTQKERETLAAIERQEAVLEKQIALKQQLIDSSKQQAAVEEQIGAVIESNTEKWREFTLAVNSVGRGDKDLTDAELRKKIDNLNADIGGRQAGLLGKWGGPTALGGPYDPLLDPQKSNLAQALAEQKMRDQVRRNVSAFGRDRAFSMFGGSEQRFNEILQGIDTSNAGRLADSIDQIRREGLKLALMGTTSGGGGG